MGIGQLEPRAALQAPRIDAVDSGGISQAYNRYTYVLNNPVRYTDPSGRMHDPNADYGGDGDYNYYHLASHPAYRQNWFQQRSRWAYIKAEAGLHWLKPGMQDYHQYLRAQTSRSQPVAQQGAATSGFTSGLPASVASLTAFSQAPGGSVSAQPTNELYWNAAPPRTYAGKELMAEFNPELVDWGDVGMDVAALGTLGVANYVKVGQIAKGAERTGTVIDVLQAGKSGRSIIEGQGTWQDPVQLALAGAGYLPFPQAQFGAAIIGLAVDIFPGVRVRSEEIWR